MPAKNKKKAAPAGGPMSDKAYIHSGNARKLPVHQCLVNEEWEESGLAQVVVCRRHVTGNLTGAFYLVDLLCTGVKDSFFFFNQPPDTLTEMQEHFAAEQDINMETCDYVLAHNIIYSAVEFAATVGIEPIQEFATTKMILEPDDDDRIALMAIECGKDGKPFLMADPSDPRTSYYVRQLEKYAGDDNDDDNDDEGYDFRFAGLETWSHEDWESFILEGPGDDLEPDEATTVYIYQKAFHKPEAAARNLDTDQLMATLTRGITHEPIVNLAYGNDPEEKKTAEEIHAVLFRGSPAAEELFPDYLFGKVAYAQKLFQTGQADKIPALFGGHFDLSSLYPHRDSFHISEFITFTTILCCYFLETGDELMADIYGTLLKKWAVDPMADFTTDVLNLLDLRLQIKVLRKLSEAGEEEVKREQLIALLMN